MATGTGRPADSEPSLGAVPPARRPDATRGRERGDRGETGGGDHCDECSCREEGEIRVPSGVRLAPADAADRVHGGHGHADRE